MTLWSNLRRLAHVSAVIGRHAVGHLLDTALQRWPRLARGRRERLCGPERLRTVFEELGGTFIKFGQMLALHLCIPFIGAIEF